MFTFTSPVTGSAIVGLTTPSYTVVQDTALSLFSKQIAVSVLGGTQTGVTSHSISSPFTGTVSRPSVLKQIAYNSNGTVKNIPVNAYRVLCRKGVTPVAGVIKNASIDIAINVPAGSETLDAANLSALFSFASGLLLQQLQGMRNMASDGIL